MFTFKEIVPGPYLGQVHQSLLTFDGINLLIDLGWDNELSLNLDYLLAMAPSIDCILLTHATVSHLGAYAKLSKYPEFSSIPVFATLPVTNMGRMVTLDMYRSVGKLGPFLDAEITVSEVEQAFDRIESLKYSQPVDLSGKLDGFRITAFNAGHTLGGTIWKVQKDHEDIVYAVDWNHSRDGHLNGAFMNQGRIVDALNKPSVMICGNKTGAGVALNTRKQALLDNIRQTIDNGGTVLIPTSTTRALELVNILDQYWHEQKIKVPLIYLSHVGKRTMSYASSMLEWMNGKIISEWEDQNNSPFDTKHMKVINEFDDVKVMDGPKLVLASGEALEAGFSRIAFAEFCSNDKNLVILTERQLDGSGSASLGAKLYKEWEKEVGTEAKGSVPLTTKMAVRYGVELPLEGEELARYNTRIKEVKQATEKEQAMEMRNKNILEEPESDTEDENFDEDVSTLDMDVLLVKNEVYDYNVQNSTKPRMYPYSLKRKRVDDYGEAIKVEDFMKVNEKQVEQVANVETRIGEKRQWAEYDRETHKLEAMNEQSIGKKMDYNGAEFKVLCKVDFIDFEGLCDERSLSMVINSIQPKKLIMIGEVQQGSFDNIEPIIALSNQSINASINSYAFSVKVSSELESLLKWQRILGDYQVAHVVGKISGDEIVPSEFGAPRSGQLWVGDIKLTELKRKLVSMGHKAEYKAEGILVCDDLVAIRKIDEGKIEIEGSGVSKEFYQTKNVVRQLLAQV